MKTQILILLFLTSLVFTGTAQNVKQEEVPLIIISTVQTKYPYANDIDWKRNEADYKAKFKTDKREHELWISSAGTILKSIEEFDKDNLPYAVTQRISSDYKGQSIDKVHRMELNGKVYYNVTFIGSPADLTATIRADGEVEISKLH